MKKILITGAAGFIGFHTSLSLQTAGYQVLGIDNFNNYYDPNLKEQRASILEASGIKVVRGELTDRIQMKKLFDAFEPTHVLNLAAQAGVRYAKKNPDAYFKSNLEGFFVLLELLKERPHIKLIYASSSSVYGDQETSPFCASQKTDAPNNLYAATKKCNELLAYSYHHLYGVNCTGLRYFTVYGPWGRPDMAYFSFTEAIQNERPIQLFNFGNMERDFTYIDDIVHGTLMAVERCSGFKVYNLGNNRPEKLETFVCILEELLGKKALIKKIAASKDEMLRTCADIEPASQDLDYKPKTSLYDGLSQFIAWYKSKKLEGNSSIILEAVIQ